MEANIVTSTSSAGFSIAALVMNGGPMRRIPSVQINVIEYLEKGALAKCPDRTAIIDGDRVCSFRNLAESVRRCACQILRRRDVLRRPVAVYLPKGTSSIIADLAIIYSGNCYMNLDVKSPLPRVKSIIDYVGPEVVITSRALSDAVAGLGVAPERVLLVEDVPPEAGSGDEARLDARRAGIIDTDPLCIINTSGSTGVPKSVVMNHRSVIDFMDWVMDELRLDGSEIIGSMSPFYFDIYTLELWLSLAKGATIVIIPDQLSTFPVKLLEYLAQTRVSFIFWVPTIMVNISNLGLLDKVDVTSLRRILFAGEVFPTKHLNYWRRHLPEAQFVNLYGPIEITVDCTYYVVDRQFRDDEPLPIGFPRRNMDVFVLNERNEPCKPGEPGELCVRGSSLALGYWNDPVRTAQAFVQNPLNMHFSELIYRTGDIVYRNELGELMFTGRKDYQIKHLGYRIELGEIEHAVLNVEGIDNACALYNKDKKEIALFYQGQTELPPGSIRQSLAMSLPKYMLPTAFHRLAELPMNPNGKIDRLKLTRDLLELKP
jgi:D-alanine--poly(phosphoribitol) ligase subunit 1